ncbi:MAG TPA: FtsX-like permease family protein [Lacunisphaera sp.]|jgi:putative ABC transport system permease protein|nr:FtsX-like permease family protein [Lacunisphaera sp.]
MRWFARVRFYLRSLVSRRKLDDQLTEEVRTHVEMATEANVAKGMPPDEARYAALREFGNVAAVQERARDEHGWVRLEQLWQDWSHAWRGLVRSPGFSTTVVLILALGIGASAAIFTLTKQALLRQGHYPDGIFQVCSRAAAGPVSPQMNDYMIRGYESSSAIAEAAKSAFMGGNVAIDGQPVATGWHGISANLLPMLDITPALGRGFLPEECQPGSDSVVIISHEFWRRQFQGDPAVLGRKISVGPDICSVVGVLKEDQAFPVGLTDNLYRPLVYRVDPQRPWVPYLFLMVRLKPGFTVDQAAAVLDGIHLDIPATYRSFTEKQTIVLMSLADFNRRFGGAGVSWVLLAAVGFLYAIACLNTSNMMLVRMLGRKRELSIRLALGAGRRRVVRLLAAEGLILSLIGAAAGVLVANWIFPVLLWTMASNSSGPGPSWRTLDGAELAFLALLTVASCLTVAAIPAVRVLRAQISSGLKDGGAALGESRGLGRLRSGLVIVQTAFAVVLLVGAGLMTQTFTNLTHIDLGYDGSQRAKVQLGYPSGYPSDWEGRLVKLHEIQAVLERLPGVASVGFCNDMLLQQYFVGTHTVEGAGGTQLKAMIRCFSVGFEQTAGLRLLRGHPLGRVHSNEILVSESLARRCWPDRDPIGQLLRPIGGAPGFGADWPGWLVVGVVADTRVSVRQSPGLVFYSDEAWNPVNYDTYVIRLNVPYFRELEASIRRALYSYDPQLVVNRVVPLDRLWEFQVGTEKVVAAALKMLGGTAGALTMIGLFSVLAYAVDRRMHEFGVRLALGASRRDLVQLVVRRGLVLAMVGLAFGLAGAAALAQFIQGMLYNTSPQDPMVLAAVSGILLGVAALACIVPSFRATRVDVTRLLRTE